MSLDFPHWARVQSQIYRDLGGLPEDVISGIPDIERLRFNVDVASNAIAKGIRDGANKLASAPSRKAAASAALEKCRACDEDDSQHDVRAHKAARGEVSVLTQIREAQQRPLEVNPSGHVAGRARR